VDVVLVVHFLDLFVTGEDVVHDNLLAFLGDIGFPLFPLLLVDLLLHLLLFMNITKPLHLIIEIIFFPLLDNIGHIYSMQSFSQLF
jgi:hypothetical protein